jgi:hypothetical protein
MVTETNQTPKWKRTIDTVKFPLLLAVACVSLYRANIWTKAKQFERDGVRREAICPALLSISRSARDTLIVMKAETLCNSYVLDNLK